MADYQKFINALRKCAKEHEKDRTFTGHIIVSDLCRDTANLLEALEQEPCEDCISRQGAIDALGYNISITSDEGLDEYRTVLKEMLGKIYDVQKAQIEALPSIQPKPKIGHWEQYGYSWEDKFKCSECGKEQPKILCGERIIGHWSDYCPNCGADMRESEE